MATYTARTTINDDHDDDDDDDDDQSINQSINQSHFYSGLNGNIHCKDH